MNIKHIVFGLAMTIVVSAFGQTIEKINIRNLKVGDDVPNLLIPKILINNTISSGQIKDYKNQLLILDFWDTYCKSCIEAMPKMQALQDKFGNRIKILLVNWQSMEVVQQFFKRNGFVKKEKINLPSIVEDTLLKQYFKHQTVPHEIWIYNGKIKAITGADYVTEENINSVLNGKEIAWNIKEELPSFDYKSPFLTLRKDLKIKNNFIRYSAVTGYLNGVKGKSGTSIDITSKTVREYVTNLPIIGAYYYGFSKMKPFPFFNAKNRIILEVKDKTRYFFDKNKGYNDVWQQENHICYETIFSDTLTNKTKGALIIADLNRLLGLNGRLESRKIKCLVLVIDPKLNPIVLAKKDIPKKNKKSYSIKNLIQTIETKNLIKNNYPIIIDESGFEGKITLNDWSSIEDLKLQLNRLGFRLVESEREAELFVLSETQ